MTEALPTQDALCALGVADLRHLYRAGALSPVDVTRAVLGRIERTDSTINAFISVLPESALASAEAAGRQIAAGIELGPLHGIPVSVKDNIAVRGTRRTAASIILKDAPPDTEDAAVVRRLRAGGAILVGKTNLYEFAFGAPDPDGPFGPVQNPRRLGHQAGSSSSGSAAAVAAGLGVISLGTDTGGSVQYPASACGVVGLKPTFGLVSTSGVIPVSTQLDHVGLLARSVADVAFALPEVTAQQSVVPCMTTAAEPYLWTEQDPKGLRLGVPTDEYFRFGVPEVVTALDHARSALEDIGLQPIEIKLPKTEQANDVQLTLQITDLAVYHTRYRDQGSLYGRDFIKRASLAQHISGVDYAKAKESQSLIRDEWVRCFEMVDIVVLPANAAGAPPHGEDVMTVEGSEYPTRMVMSRFNRVSNLTGFPAISVPIDTTKDGLPISAQLVAPPHSEARLISVAESLEQATGNLSRRWGIEINEA